MKPRPFWQTFGGRIVRLFLLLLLAVQGLGFWLIRAGIDRSAREQLAQGLARAEGVLREQLDQRGELLAAGAASLAADYGLLSTLELPGDTATLASALEDKRGRLRGADVVAVLTPDQQLLASAGPAAEGLSALVASGPVWPERGALVALVGMEPVQLVRVPIGQRGDRPKAWLVAGDSLAHGLTDLARLSQVDLSLVRELPGTDPALVQSTRSVRQEPLPEALLRARQQTTALRWGEDEVEVRVLPLDGGATGQARLLLSLSVDEAVRPFAAAQAALGWVSLLGVLLFGAGSLLMARRVVAPVRALVQASRRLGSGDYDSPVPAPPRDDELAELAQAFERMREGIAQRTEHIRQLAYRDSLTGLPNRAQCADVLAAWLAEGRPVAVLMLNLDRLERVNQVLGRAHGDAVLRHAAERLRSHADTVPGALAGRVGGDEFALLLPDLDAEAGAHQARALARRFEQPVTLDDSLVDLSAGVGVAAAPLHAGDAESLLARALLAMTEAKRRMAGVLVYEPSIDAGSAQTLSLLGELRRALRRQELRLYLQPKWSLAERRITGAEALVRWQHPERGLVPPAGFIPFAEETGFIHELTVWVVDEAARLSALLAARGVALKLSVNLSAHDLMKPDLLGRLRAVLARHAVEASALCLEITESAIAHDPQRALQTLHALRREGFRLSIDDFGAGQTSLAQLIDLPVDELKLDMLFVRPMGHDAHKASMVGSLIRMGHDRGLSVVAEGVEDETVLARLAELGCDEAQGWQVGRPEPALALIERLAAG